MDAVFGESASPNLESQIAIFAENCRLKKELDEKKIAPLKKFTKD